jgi:hypothetical protein
VRYWFVPIVALAVTACAPKPPPRWAEGGAVLALPEARWDRPDDDPIEIHPDGKVTEGSTVRFVLDRVGRVTDSDYDPFAVLLPDGRLVGTDAQPFGYVGVSNASPPGSEHAWLAVQPDGKVVYFDPDGDRSLGGVWRGCAGPGQRACTLVTQIFALRNYTRHRNSGVTFGIGVGVPL